MSAEPPSKGLHLPSLSVKGLRGIADLSIPRLGRVTLIAGKNGVGKTTLLDAVRIYASRGRYSILTSILKSREELITVVDEDGDEISAPDYEALFHGRYATEGSTIGIGSDGLSKQLRIKYGLNVEDGEEDSLIVEFNDTAQEIPISAFFREARYPLRAVRDDESERPDFRCLDLGPSLPTNAEIARLWDKVALTDDEDRATRALQLIFHGDVSRIAVIAIDDDAARPRLRFGRRAVVRINGQERPVPLKSLGDGAVRLFGVALALANSQDGFLLIDEAENGIHHSVQRDFWKMVMRTAHENNVQVLATTHGWDCVVGFAQAAKELKEVEGVLIRLDKHGDEIRAVEYSEEELIIAAEQDIEVR